MEIVPRQCLDEKLLSLESYISLQRAEKRANSFRKPLRHDLMKSRRFYDDIIAYPFPLRFGFHSLEDCSLLVVQFIILAQSPQTNRTFHLFVKYSSAVNVRVSSSKIFSKIHDENGTCAVACTSTLRQMGLKVNNVLRKMHFSCSIFIHGQTSTANLSRKLILKVIRVRF